MTEIPLAGDDVNAVANVVVRVDGAGRLRALYDGYGRAHAERVGHAEAIAEKTRIGVATYRAWGRDQRRPGWAEMWDRDEDRYLVAHEQWFEARRRQVAEWLR